MTLTDRQKKIAWIVGGILLAIHFAPGLWSSARQAWTSRDHASHSQKASPTHYAPAVPPTPAPVPAPSPDAQFAKLMGIWYGTGIKPGSTDFCSSFRCMEPFSTGPVRIVEVGVIFRMISAVRSANTVLCDMNGIGPQLRVE